MTSCLGIGVGVVVVAVVAVLGDHHSLLPGLIGAGVTVLLFAVGLAVAAYDEFDTRARREAATDYQP